MRSVFRVIVAFAAAAMVWLVAGQARAAAPLCDERGATTFAKNPTLQEPNVSIDVGMNDCVAADTSDDRAYDDGHGSAPQPNGHDAPPALVPWTVQILPPLFTEQSSPVADSCEGPPGFQHQVDRPPRG